MTETSSTAPSTVAAMFGSALVFRAAKTIHDHVGQHLLAPVASQLARTAARTLAFRGGSAASELLPVEGLPAQISSIALKRVLTDSAKSIGRGVGHAAIGGALLEGAGTLFHGVNAWRRGEKPGLEVAQESGTHALIGGVAAAAGTAAAAGVIAATGGAALPFVLGVGAGASQVVREHLEQAVAAWRASDSGTDPFDVVYAG